MKAAGIVGVSEIVTAAVAAAAEQMTTAVLSKLKPPPPKRSFETSSSSNSTVEAIVSSANKRMNLLDREHFDIDFERKIPKEIQDFLVPLFTCKGVCLQDLEMIALKPKHHHINELKTKVPEVMVVPPKDANETLVVYFNYAK